MCRRMHPSTTACASESSCTSWLQSKELRAEPSIGWSARLPSSCNSGRCWVCRSASSRAAIAIAQALVNDPPLLILDEPTNALDAYQVIEVRALIRSLVGRRTVLVASHVLTEIERVASRVMILLDGRLLTTDAMREAGHARQF